ncbi:lipocalin family protein [Algoriphagus litoralis]|uniref:lipocalin family protein n=1 Tax=Algoriphagus litoralis TaxID=2202829 RepID=UPI000DB9631C|nr:lipocalin family protein [Algoriphagus litoralis]
MLKKFPTFFLFVFLSFSLFSCGEDESNPSSDDLTGSWALQSMVYEGTITSVFNGEELAESPMSGEASNISMVFNFDNGKLISTGQMNVSVEYDDFAGVDFVYPITGAEYSGTYTRSGNSLDIKVLTSTIKAEIVTLTETELVLNIEREYKLSGEGLVNTSNETGVMRFTKN